MRERLRGWLDDAGIDGKTGDDLMLACTEAVNNAVAHPVLPSLDVVEVIGNIDGKIVILTIRDYGRWDDGGPSPERDHHGFPLMNALMDSVDVSRSPTGTTVTLQRSI